MSQVVDVLVTIVLFVVILGGIVLFHELGHFITARLARVRVLEFGVGFPPRARVLRTGKPSPEDVALAARRREAAIAAAQPPGGARGDPGPGARDADRDPVHAQLAAHRRLREARGRGRRPRRRPSLVRPGPAAREARHPRRRRVHEPAAVARDLHRHRVVRDARTSGSRSTRSSPDRRPPRPASSPATRSSPSTATSTTTSASGRARRPWTSSTAWPARRSPSASSTRTAPPRRSRSRSGRRRRSRPPRAPSASGRATSSFLGGYASRPFPEAVRIGVSQTTHWFGLILDGLHSLGKLDRHRPDRRTAGPGSASGIATSLFDVFSNAGDRDDALRRRDPVGQPRPRERPAVPAARRRPDAGHPAQGDPALRAQDLAARRAARPTRSASWRCSRS